MDTLTKYIQNGKKLTALKLFCVFFLLTILIVCAMGIKLHYALSSDEFKTFLAEIPVIEIEGGTVTKPEKTVWSKKMTGEQFLFQIDTTNDQLENPPENGIALTAKKVVFTLNGQVKEYPLPQKKVVVDTSFLLHLMQMIALNTCVIIGIILLLLFLLGQVSTSILTSFCLWLFKKEVFADQIRRSAFVGWLSVLFLNIILMIAGYGLPLLTCVLIATIISVFGLIWGKKN